jgi:hypothetical protein
MAIATAQDLITKALQQLRVYSSVETPLDADFQLGLDILNTMLDSWSNENLFCYCIQEQSFPLVVGQNQYTIGLASLHPNVVGTRPLKIIEGPVSAYIMDENQNRYPVQVIDRNRWNMIGLLTNTSNIPDTLFYDPQFPLGIINVFPTPNESNTLYFDSYLQFSDFSSLTSTISLPPGYVAAIIPNLAIWLSTYFKSSKLDPVISGLASDSKAAIKRTNARVLKATYDPEIVSRASPTYNIYRDSTAGR